MKIKLTYVERKGEKEKQEQICKVEQRQIKKIQLKINCKGKSIVGKANNKCRKNNNRFKKLKLKKEKRKKKRGKLHRTAKAHRRGRGL